MVAFLNEKFEYECINENAYLRILGYTSNDFLGKKPRNFAHLDDIKRAVNTIKRGLIDGAIMEEFRIRHKDGHYFCITFIFHRRLKNLSILI